MFFSVLAKNLNWKQAELCLPDLMCAVRVVSRLKMVAFKRFGRPKKCPQT